MEKLNNLLMEKGKIILNGKEIPLVWNYELIKKQFQSAKKIII